MPYSHSTNFEKLTLKKDSRVVAISTSEQCRLAALSMARQAARSIDIVSRQLDPRMYDNRDFCEAVSRFAVGSRHARVRVLLRHIDPVVKRGHQLVTLAQRLSSFIEVRVPAKEFDEYNAAFLVVDGAGVIHRTLSDSFEGTVNFNDPRMAHELTRQFDDMWQTAASDTNLRRSHL